MHGKTTFQSQNHNLIPNESKIIGVAVGVGSYGHHLKPYENSETFITIDGGISWKQIFKEARICEIADHGSLIVCAPFDKQTTSVSYFCF